MELSATLAVLRREPHPLRVVRRLVLAAARAGMKPREAFVFDLDRRSDEPAGAFLSKRSAVRIQDILNPAQHHHLVQDKLAYHIACVERGVAAPRILAVLGFGPDGDRAAELRAQRIDGEADLEAFLTSQLDGTRLIFKKINGSHGEGLLALTVSGAGAIAVDGTNLDAAAILRHCEVYRSGRGYLVQHWLQPDPAFGPVMPGPALGAVRLITMLIGQEVQIPFGTIRLPIGSNVIDDLDFGRTGNLIAEVGLTDGTLGRAWGPSRTRAHRLEICPVRPDTGAPIEGFRIPYWPEILRVVSTGARAFPELTTLGWDVVVTSDGIQLLEANHHWDPHGTQVTLQRGIGPEMAGFLAQARPS